MKLELQEQVVQLERLEPQGKLEQVVQLELLELQEQVVQLERLDQLV